MSAPALQRLDLFAAPLEGIRLIEASAGTGKTWTITGLYLRLVVEAGHTVDRILVVTYTKAATAELRDRIRKRLAAARQAFADGDSEDAVCRRLLAGCADRQLALQRITLAVRGFDEAAVFTIHGFCQRVLSDAAFDSGMPFETELVPDQRELLQEVVDDFWRREMYGASAAFVEYALGQKLTPDGLLNEVRGHIGKPFLKIQGPAAEQDCAPLEQAFTDAYGTAQALWRQDGAVVQRLLSESAALHGAKYPKSALADWYAEMDRYLRAAVPGLKHPQKLAKFTTAELAAAVKKGQRAPEHPFFDACEALHTACEGLAQAYQRQLRTLKLRLLDYCGAELERRKQREQVQSYDDLLINLQRALADERRGEMLARAVRERYRAALIDEFQDTDPVQYAIFRRVYADSRLPVFLVGDPKQAIYSFRGADIFAYLRARVDAEGQYTLDVNWRSDPRLIEAVNAVFAHARQPFLFAAIPFLAAQPAEREREPLLLDGAEQPPFQLWLVRRGEDGKRLGKGAVRERIARAVAAEIADLLNRAARGRVRVGDRPLDGGDIAVLVRSHGQGSQVRDALLRLGVPSVQQAQDNVFTSPEAQELERVLLAVLEPGNERHLRAALATDMLGVSGAELHRLGEDEEAWEQRLEAFGEYHRLWRERGFMPMFRALITREQVALRLLAFRDGERRLTNCLHLAELLQAQAARTHPGMEGLLKWLTSCRQSPTAEDEEAQLRLESDEHLVKIVTLHKSKGLEYPVVFCPFLWDGKLWSDGAAALTVHDPDDDYAALLDFGSDRLETLRTHALREELAENLRLLYVALTRAKHRCYMVWGAISEAERSAPAWLLHAPADPDLALDTLAAHVKDLSDEDLVADLERLVQRAAGAIALQPLPEDPGARYRPRAQVQARLVARSCQAPVPAGWRMLSFTALTADRAAELPDHDAVIETPGTDTASAGPVERTTGIGPLDIAGFPRGRRPGRCLHALFERLDFARSRPADRAVLAEKTLQEHGYGSEWVPAVCAMVERVLETPMLAERELRLAAITGERRLNELEFYYPVAAIDAYGLRRLLRRHGLGAGPLREQFDALSFSPAGGYMKGYIDLVFEADGRYYLADYKSNRLGADAAAYRIERLPAVMARESYTLQYLIYTVALHRYLGLRLPGYDYDSHFGGVLYLFLRGMDPALGPDYGVFRDRPARALIEALDGYLAAGGGG